MIFTLSYLIFTKTQLFNIIIALLIEGEIETPQG